MDTAHYLRTITRQWWLILITVLAGGLGGFLVYHYTTPLYQSSIQLIVSGSGGDREVAIERAQALGQIAGTLPAVTDAMQTAGYPGAASAVTASASGRDPFITVQVVDPSPQIAQSVADAYQTSLVGTALRLEGQPAGPFTIAVVAPAQLASEPFTPIPYRDIGLGLIAGLILGISLALLRDSLNRTVRSGEQLERLTGLTILGAIPRDSPKSLLPVATDPRGLRAEAYRQIRSSLLNSSLGRLQLIAVTSASPGEGKTSVTCNVAVAFSRAGHRVAIIDADLRRPRVAEYFGVEVDRGLTDVLAGECNLDDVMTIMDDGRLALLTSGRIPANPSEALGGVLMEKVLAQLATEYEFIFVDTPPVLPVADALVLAPKVDAMMIVVKVGATTRERVRLAMSSLARVNAVLLGVVPNQVGKASDSYYSNRYSYSYKPKGGKASDEVEIPPNALRSPGAAAAGTVKTTALRSMAEPMFDMDAAGEVVMQTMSTSPDVVPELGVAVDPRMPGSRDCADPRDDVQTTSTDEPMKTAEHATGEPASVEPQVVVQKSADPRENRAGGKDSTLDAVKTNRDTVGSEADQPPVGQSKPYLPPPPNRLRSGQAPVL